MARLPILRPREVVRAYKNLGFVEDHTTGSHLILYHPRDKKRAVIPLHIKDLPRGTLAAILRESNITREEFLQALKK
ncbi:MAG: type II toxin-antitoxin system HicA family toxin [Chloroflexi bacterium]|nr:type II toxin-antitoxin system HicA family toxin [Chloroflexota bacterium]